MGLNMICSAATNMLSKLGQHSLDSRTIVILTLAVLCATAPLDLSQIVFTIVGAVAYALLQTTQVASSNDNKTLARSTGASGGKPRTPGMRPKNITAGKPAGEYPRRTSPGGTSPGKQREMGSTPIGREYRQPSSQPVESPNFTAIGFEAEVDELIGQISPSSEGDAVVERLANSMKQILCKMIPEVEVVGFASGDLLRGTAFGVAVPEVDIVVSASPHVLAARMQGRFVPQVQPTATQLDMRKLQKSVIRACTDKLVSTGGFKFRRSAFRGQEPKVTLLAHATLGIYSASIPLDFSVNSTTPLHNAALFTECGQIEPRAKALILLVKRWAKDRGVCHAAKGHLSPFAWTLLTIYFLQVGVDDEGALLPPLEGFLLSSGLAGPGQGTTPTSSPTKARKPQPNPGIPKQSVGALFKNFIHFYTSVFDWRKEACSVRLGQRAAPDLSLPLHIVLHEDGATTQVGPSIEHPFEQGRNLGECTTAPSLKRLHEEFTRAEELCTQSDVSLSKVLEPWVPPERGALQPGGCKDDEDEEEVGLKSPQPPWRAERVQACY